MESTTFGPYLLSIKLKDGKKVMHARVKRRMAIKGSEANYR